MQGSKPRGVHRLRPRFHHLVKVQGLVFPPPSRAVQIRQLSMESRSTVSHDWHTRSAGPFRTTVWTM